MAIDVGEGEIPAEKDRGWHRAALADPRRGPVVSKVDLKQHVSTRAVFVGNSPNRHQSPTDGLGVSASVIM